jgi:hypothetical protein
MREVAAFACLNWRAIVDMDYLATAKVWGRGFVSVRALVNESPGIRGRMPTVLVGNAARCLKSPTNVLDAAPCPGDGQDSGGQSGAFLQ